MIFCFYSLNAKKEGILKKYHVLLLLFIGIVLCSWLVYEQNPGVREARYEAEQKKVFQKARSQYSELEKLADKGRSLQEKADQFVKLSNTNRIFLSNKRERIQVPIESAPKIVQALFSAEASYWTDKLHGASDSEIKIFLIQQAYQYIALSGQDFHKFGFSEDDLNNQYKAAVLAWNAKHKNDAPGSIALPPTILICPIYTVTLNGQPMNNSGLDQIAKAVVGMAKGIKN